jgi:hypothetical protein
MRDLKQIGAPAAATAEAPVAEVSNALLQLDSPKPAPASTYPLAALVIAGRLRVGLPLAAVLALAAGLGERLA